MSDPPKEVVSRTPSRDDIAIAQATEFIHELRVIRDSDRGRMSALKRCAGIPIIFSCSSTCCFLSGLEAKLI